MKTMTAAIGNLRCLFRRLYIRISFDIVIIILVPQVIILLLLAYNLRESVRDITLAKFETSLNERARLASSNIDFISGDVSFIAEHLEEHFSGLENVAKEIATGIPPRNWYRAAKFKNLMDDLETMLLMNKGFLKLRIINASGREIVRFDRTPSGIKEIPFEELEDKSERDYFKNAILSPPGKVYLHPVTLDVEHGNVIVPHLPVLRMSRKIMAGGEMTGIVVLTVNPDAVLGPQTGNGGSTEVVLDESGAYLRNRDKNLLLGGEPFRNVNIFDELPQLKTNLATSDVLTVFDAKRGEYRVWRKVFYRSDDREHYWVLLDRHPEFSIVQGYTEMLVKYAAILAAVVLAGLGLMATVIYKALHPLTNVTEAMRKRQAGDMNVRVAVTAVENEIGEIGTAFNAMADRLGRVQDDLRTALAMQRSISDIAPTAHIIANVEGTIISVNPAAVAIFGYPPEELTGKNVKMLVPSSKEDEYSKYIQDYLKHKKKGLLERRRIIRTPVEVTAARKNGEIFYASLFIKEVPLEDGDIFVGIIEDVTERRVAERALAVAAANSEAIMNATEETLGLVGREGDLIAINEAGAKRFNAHRADLIGKSLYQIMPFHVALKRMEYYEEVMRTGKPLTFEDERDGRLFQQTAYPAIDRDTKITRVAVFAADVTERRRWERMLAENEAKMRAVLTSVPDAVILTDEKGIVEMFNPAAVRIFGWTAEEVLGQNIKMIVPEPFQSEHDRYLENYLRTGIKKLLGRMREVEGLRKDGSCFPAELYVTELWLRKTRKFLGIVKDISERKRAEDALQKSMKNLAMAQHIAHLGSWELDLATLAPSWSDETFRLLGYEPGEIEPSFDAFIERIHPDDRTAVMENLETVMHGADLPPMLQRIVRPDGDERTAKVSGEVVRDEAGKPVRLVGTVHDVTELKKLEKLRDDFFHSVVHDLKSPITGILLELDVMAAEMDAFTNKCFADEPCRTMFSGHKSSLDQMVADMRDGIGQLHLMIQSLLKLGELEEEKLNLQYEAFGMNELFGELEHDFRMRAAAKGKAVEFASSFSGTAIADRKLLKRVLQNLIDNALKYSYANSKITVHAASGKTGGVENIVISVTNTGTPLTGEKINNLFRKFKTHGHADSGSGIGLFFCQKTMNLLGGGISVDQDGNVITFHIFFPNG